MSPTACLVGTAATWTGHRHHWHPERTGELRTPVRVTHCTHTTFHTSNVQILSVKEGEIKECVLTTLVGGAAAVCGVGIHCQHFTLQADRWRLRTRGAHCREHTHSYLSDELNDELMSHRNVRLAHFWNWLQMWVRQQLPSALVAIRVWSSLQDGMLASQRLGLHSAIHAQKH